MQAERIATLLASGLPHTSVATIVGISPARISQLLKEPEFELLYAAKQAENKEKDVEELNLSAKYLEAEHILIKQVIDMAPVSELRDVTAALRVVGERQEKAKSRMNPIVAQQAVYNTIVQLSLPAHATPELAFGQSREVIAIENRNLAPLSSGGVLSLFKGLDSTQKQLSDAERSGAQCESSSNSSNSNTASSTKLNAISSIEGNSHEPIRSPQEAERSSGEALPFQTLAASAKRFLDSLHPAPLAETF